MLLSNGYDNTAVTHPYHAPIFNASTAHISATMKDDMTSKDVIVKASLKPVEAHSVAPLSKVIRARFVQSKACCVACRDIREAKGIYFTGTDSMSHIGVVEQLLSKEIQHPKALLIGGQLVIDNGENTGFVGIAGSHSAIVGFQGELQESRFVFEVAFEDVIFVSNIDETIDLSEP